MTMTMKYIYLNPTLYIVSKILESVILIKCGEYLTTSDNQFGFKSCHSTDLCIYALK